MKYVIHSAITTIPTISLILKEISFQDIFLDHSVGVKKRTVERNAMPHDVHKTISIPVEERKNNPLQFVVNR